MRKAKDLYGFILFRIPEQRLPVSSPFVQSALMGTGHAPSATLMLQAYHKKEKSSPGRLELRRDIQRAEKKVILIRFEVLDESMRPHPDWL